MIVFDEGDARFNYRVAGIALDGNRVLFTRVETEDFWFLPGGRVELLETSGEALIREMKEELGVEVRIERLLWVVENFFELDGKSYHELGLYFLMTLPRNCSIYKKNDVFEGNEDGLKVIFKWYPLDILDKVPIVPSFLCTGLLSIPDGITHVVHADE